MGLIYRNKLAPPVKSESGNFLWTDDDVPRIRAALAVDRRRRRGVADPVSVASVATGQLGATASNDADVPSD
jgi:hypothetical protein